MRRYHFGGKHFIDAHTAAEFLEQYAMMNDSDWRGHLLGAEGGKTLMLMRTMWIHNSSDIVDPHADYETFVTQCEALGMFTTEVLNDLEVKGEM